MNVFLTINLGDGTECDLSGEIADFRDIREFLNNQMGEFGIDPGKWSSVLLTIVNDDARNEVKRDD